MHNLNRLEYFIAIAEEGSITAAARRLRVSKGVVSKQLLLLEEELGTTLFARNPRHMNITETGGQFYEAARAAVAQANEAYELVLRKKEEPAGTLRIAAPLDFGVAYVVPAAGAFGEKHPKVKIDLNFSDARFDPVESRFDIAFRGGWLTDSANVARKFGSFREFVVATPAFFERHGVPENPEELEKLPFVENRALKTPSDWTFLEAKREVSFKPAFSADTTSAVKAVVMTGAAFAVLPDFLVARELQSGQLRQVLLNFTLEEGGLYAVFPPTPFRSAATRAFADFFDAYWKQQISAL